MPCEHTVVDKFLKRFFYHIGKTIGEQPGYFLIVPLLLTALCASGFQRIKFVADPEYLFSPVDGEAKLERAVLDQHFPTNYSQFDPSRSSKAGRFGRLLITAADGGSLLRTSVWREIHFLDEIIQNVTIEWEGEDFNYQQLCALTLDGYCWYNEILEIGSFMDRIEAQNVSLTYPIWLSPETFKGYTFPMYFGGIELSEINTIDKAAALSLTYFLDAQEDWQIARGSAWEASFLATVSAQNLPNIKITRFSSLTLEQELEENTNSVIPYFSLNIGVMIVFCILTCMMTDWVKSKPLLGLFGVISAILASISAFGMVMYLGMDFIGINLAAPFLMLGIGIDDTFVMLAAWRRTSSHDPIPVRMGNCYREAAVSITITSVTDMLSFWIGVITPFPCVKIFCVYTGACVIFTYLWHITFFGGCMAVAGYAEKQNRHALSCCVVLPKSQAGSKGFFYNVFCSGGINKDDPFNPKDNKDNGMMVFFRDVIGNWLNKPYAKALVLTIFVIYLGFASWGVTNLQEGLEKKRLSRFDSYSVDYYEVEDEFFREYPFRINVVVSGALDYSQIEVQQDMEDLLSKLENTTFIDPLYTESWLRSFLDYVERWKDYPDYYELKVDDEQNFIKTLKDVYLINTPFVQDIDFDTTTCPGNIEDCKGNPGALEHIVGARFLLQGHQIQNSQDEAKFVQELRDICHASKYNVTVFHPYFIYFDQFLVVLPTTIQCVVIAAVVMMFISLIFIPNPVCSLWVAFAIISIELGVLGFMTFWHVNLDSISMINLIMCIGFSVDFAAHISYHYMDSEGTPDDRVRNSLYGLGLPIVQGAVSTILGVIGLMIAPSYIFVTFFKMVFLVICLGALHGIFLLPVLLSIFGPGSCSKGEKSKLKSPTTSYLSDGESLPGKTDTESRQSSRKPSPSLNYGGEELRIPRPTTGTSTHPDQDTRTSSSSTPHLSSSVPATGRPDKSRRSRKSHEPPIHEMYHNNGYISEEDSENFKSEGWLPHSWGQWAPPPHPSQVRYFNGFPGGAPPPHMYPAPYGYPVDQRHSYPSSRQHSKERRCKSKSDCKRKRPKQ